MEIKLTQEEKEFLEYRTLKYNEFQAEVDRLSSTIGNLQIEQKRLDDEYAEKVVSILEVNKFTREDYEYVDYINSIIVVTDKPAEPEVAPKKQTIKSKLKKLTRKKQ